MKRVSLLWIDDMQNWTNIVQANLKIIAAKYNIDLHIVSAINGEEIVKQCMMFEFDVVIMDFHMEPFNGNKYIKDIRDEEHLEHIPILFYSEDNSSNLEALIIGFKKVEPIYRRNLEDRIKELFFK